MKKLIIAFMFLTTPAFAFDWSQPITDETGAVVPDWKLCSGKDPAKDVCEVPMTIGALASRQLCAPQPAGKMTPETADLECGLGYDIHRDAKRELTPDELKQACDAIGRSPFPIAVHSGWTILGCKKAVK